MRVLLDENLHVGLRHLFAEGIEAETVRYREWTNLDNGDLLRAAEADYDVFVTMDQNIPDQQNLIDFDLDVLIIHAKSNEYDELAPLMPDVNRALRRMVAGQVTHIGADLK